MERGTGAAARDGLLMAMGTLTALRVPSPAVVDRAAARVAMTLAFLPGAVLAAAAVAALAVAERLGLPPLGGATLAVGLLALMTRGLHLDGLADTADGLAASYDRLRALAIMKTGDAGPAGVTTLVLVLLLQVSVLAAVWAQAGWFGAATAVVASRAVLAVACMRGVPPARPDGLGAMVAGTVPVVWATAVLLGLAVATAALGAATGNGVLTGPLAVLAAVGVTAAVLLRAGARLGGMTGDVLGAVVEVALAAALVTVTVLTSP